MTQRPSPTGPKPRSGRDLATELLKASGPTPESYTAAIASSDQEWQKLSSIFRPLPVPEQADFLDTIYQNLRAEYYRQFQEATDRTRREGGAPPSEATFSINNPEAQTLKIRIMIVRNVLVPCGEAPNYTFPELTVKLLSLKVEERRRFAQAILNFFPDYGLDQWIDLYGDEATARGSKFTQWNSFQWEQLREYLQEIEQTYNKLLQEELISTGQGLEADRMRILSSDTDVVRVVEAMKQARIIDPETKGPQIVQAFKWQGKLNEKPRNYASFARQLESPPSSKIVELIKVLLESAGDDIKREIVEFCQKR